MRLYENVQRPQNYLENTVQNMFWQQWNWFRGTVDGHLFYSPKIPGRFSRNLELTTRQLL